MWQIPKLHKILDPKPLIVHCEKLVFIAKNVFTNMCSLDRTGKQKQGVQSVRDETLMGGSTQYLESHKED